MKTISINLYSLLDKDEIRECPCCGAYSAFYWKYSNVDINTHDRITDNDESDTIHIHENIYHVGASSCFEWQCGKCKAYLTEVDSPLTANVFTHCDD